MTVYVDDMQLPARVGRLNARWSHLTADSREELITFALAIGLRRSWIQDKPSGVHFDVTESLRQKAIRAGAVPVRCRSNEWMRLCEVSRDQYRQLVADQAPTPRRQ